MLCFESRTSLPSPPLPAGSFATSQFRLRVVRVPVVDFGLHERRQVLALPALDRPQIVREEVVPHARAAVMWLRREDRLGREVRAAVLMTADAVRRRVAFAELEIRVAAPTRRTGAAVHCGK